LTSGSILRCIESAASFGVLRPMTAACDSSRKIACACREASNYDVNTSAAAIALASSAG
jgi:hypothetical protein